MNFGTTVLMPLYLDSGREIGAWRLDVSFMHHILLPYFLMGMYEAASSVLGKQNTPSQ